MTPLGFFILLSVVVAVAVLVAGGFALGYMIARRDLERERELLAKQQALELLEHPPTTVHLRAIRTPLKKDRPR